MAKIPTILEAGRADGKLITSDSIFDENKGIFQSELNDVQDTLNSDNPNKPLSANQGKILKELLDNKVIETGSIPIDSEPILGNTTHIVNSDGLAKEFNKSNTTIINTDRIANEAIVPSKLSTDIQSLISNLSKTATFAGIATPTTNPGTPEGPVFYIATIAGSYSNFSNIEVLKGETVILKWNSDTWTKSSFKPITDFDSVFDTNGKSLTEFESGIIYDVSAHNNGTVFESLSALLSDGNLSTLIPTSVRRGGMSIKFIQSSDNKYVQYFLTKNVWSDNEVDWQKLNLEEEVSQEAKKNYINLIQSEQLGIITSKTDITNPINGYYNESGVFVSSDSFINQKVTIDHSKIYYVEMVVKIESNYTISTIVLFDSNDNVIGVQKYTETYNNKYFFKFPNSVSKFAISNTPNKFHIYEVTVNEEGVPDGAVTTPKIADGAVTTPKIADGAVTLSKLANGSVNSDKILNGSVTNRKTNFFKLGANLLDPTEVHDKEYYSNRYISNDNYCASGYIEVEPETTYYFKNYSLAIDDLGNVRFLCWLDENKSTILLEPNPLTSSTSPIGAKYAVITYYRDYKHDKSGDLYFGKENIVNLTEFPTYKYKIPVSLVDFSDESFQINTDHIANGAITQEKIANGVHVAASPSRFGVLTSEVQTVAAGATINTPFILGFKNISIIAHIDSALEEVIIGGGKDGFYQVAFKIDGTNVQMLTGSSATVQWTEAHGLTLGLHTLIYVTTYYGGTSKITIYNDEGEFWSHSINYGDGGGCPFLTNNGNSTIDAELKFEMRDINQKIWLFGDSYFSYSSNSRWPYYMNADGFTENLISSLGGSGSQGAIQSFTNLIATGAKPSFAVWCMGMNDGSDTNDTTPTSGWLTNTQAFLTLCETYGIIPILATIPTVPNINHSGKTSWVKNSGCRYIDFAKAVEVSGTTTWKNWGTEKAMLSSDEVHPTAYGAKALYQQVIRDFPEIMVTC